MRKFLIATTALALTLGVAQAQEPAKKEPSSPTVQDATSPNDTTTSGETENQAAGATAGAATGAVAGAVVGGPIGAVIGGFAGAALGAATAVPEPAVEYVVANPTPVITYEGELAEGVVLPETITLNPIPEYPEYGYVYVQGRPVLVRLDNRQVVYSPGYVVAPDTVTYVEANPIDPVTFPGEIVVGATVSPDIQLSPIPSDPAYSYVYTSSGPVLVNNHNRTIVWIAQ